MKNLLTFTFLSIITFCQAQTNTSENDDNKTYTEVTEPATPILAMEKYYEEIGKHIKYTDEAKKANITGKVLVEFVVEKNGTVNDLKILKGIGYGCDEVALDAIKKAGNWNPGKLDGKIVRQKLIIPINFALEAKSKN